MKNKHTLSLILVFFSLLNSMAQVPLYLDNNQDIEKRVEHALSLLTLEEKVAMCHAQSKFSSKGVERLGIPEIYMSDGPHGIREELLWDAWAPAQWTNDSCTAFPALTCLAGTFNPEMAYIYGKAIGEEARYRRKDILLGPGVNIYRTPLNGRNFEYMGEDPYLASILVSPYIKGVQSNGVAACVKHFALNNQEHWRHEVDVQVSDRALYEIYLPAFEAAVKAGVWSLMGSYNKFRGHWCSHNDLLLNKILKKDWNFDGAVISDWGAVHNAEEAALGGLDIEMGTGTDGLSGGKKNAYDYYYLANQFLVALKAGKYPISVLDDKVRRILRLIFRTAMNKERPFGSFASPEHALVARTIGSEGVVLLKNSNSILPITPNKFKKIAILGENAIRKQTLGGGSSALKVKNEISPLSGLQNALGSEVTVNFAMAYASGKNNENTKKINSDSLRNEAVNLAKQSDLVIIIGGLNKNPHQDCEGTDRTEYELPYEQNALINEVLKVNKNIVFINISGNAVAMPWVNNVPAIIQAWYLGSEAGNILADILTGKVNPSGKLPFSFPVKLSDCSAHNFGTEAYPGKDSRQEEYKDDILVGYRWYDTKKITPLFPFGHGLSYTTFEYSNIKAPKIFSAQQNEIEISVDVKNTGKVSGKEVIQLYIKDLECSLLRPDKELKDFQKIELKPNETKTINFKLKQKAFQFFDTQEMKWKAEAGKFQILLGTSSKDIRQEASIELK